MSSVVKYFFGVVVKLKTKQTFEACLLPQVCCVPTAGVLGQKNFGVEGGQAKLSLL